jgi:hypothetical protein
MFLRLDPSPGLQLGTSSASASSSDSDSSSIRRAVFLSCACCAFFDICMSDVCMSVASSASTVASA